jgi:hypothetical protein
VDLPGPQNLTMNQFAEELGATQIRHVPRPALKILASATPFAPAFGRQAGTALLMDTLDMTVDPTAAHARFPDTTWDRLTDLVNTVRT